MMAYRSVVDGKDTLVGINFIYTDRPRDDRQQVS
jgi:hypothetical protein